MLFLLTTNVWAQSSGFNYKALITNNGTALATQSVDVKFTLLDGTSTAVYEETHATTTDANGIVSVLLGEGAVVSGDFSTIDWTNNYSLKVEIDTQDGSGYQDFGTNPFKYVPYAKYAEKAGNVFSGDFDDLTNVPAGIADGDDDTQLTEVQVDAMVANNGYLTTEVDGSITNELQNLSLQNDTLSISNGNRVIFANWDTDVTDDVHSLNDLSDARSNSYSVYLGNDSGAANNSSNNNNVGIGVRALQDATNAEKNVAVGYEAMQNNLVGKSNVAVGDRAIYQNLKDDNTAIGFNTLYENINGYHNVALGYRAGYQNTGSHNIFIGSEAGYYETGSNKLYIANSNTSSPLIYGDFSAKYIKINGELHGKDSGDADMKAYIYGSITSGGQKYSRSSSGFTVTKLSTGKYKITFTNSPGSSQSYTVVASMNYGFLGFITVVNHSTYFEVRTYNTSAGVSDESFNFVVYKK